MDICYKLTDSDGSTKGGLRWWIGVQHFVTQPRPELCSPGVLHAYRTPALAAFMHPAHVAWSHPRLYRVRCEIVVDDGLKVGSYWMQVIDHFPLPEPKIEQRVYFGIRAALETSCSPQFKTWAENWISGKDRSRAAANAAYYAANAAANAANAAYYAAAYYAASAANAANAAYYAASAAADKTVFTRIAEEALIWQP